MQVAMSRNHGRGRGADRRARPGSSSWRWEHRWRVLLAGEVLGQRWAIVLPATLLARHRGQRASNSVGQSDEFIRVDSLAIHDRRLLPLGLDGQRGGLSDQDAIRFREDTSNACFEFPRDIAEPSRIARSPVNASNQPSVGDATASGRRWTGNQPVNCGQLRGIGWLILHSREIASHHTRVKWLITASSWTYIRVYYRLA
jgi:hypothetical protein